MAIYVLKWSDQSGTDAVAHPGCAGEVVENRYELDLSQAPLKGVTLAVNDIIDMGLIPALSKVVDVIIDSDDLDSAGTPTLAFDVGVITGTPGDSTGSRTCGNEFFAASTIARAGGVERMSKSAGFRVVRANADQSIGLKITTAAATLPTTGKLGLTVFVRG